MLWHTFSLTASRRMIISAEVNLLDSTPERKRRAPDGGAGNVPHQVPYPRFEIHAHFLQKRYGIKSQYPPTQQGRSEKSSISAERHDKRRHLRAVEPRGKLGTTFGCPLFQHRPSMRQGNLTKDGIGGRQPPAWCRGKKVGEHRRYHLNDHTLNGHRSSVDRGKSHKQL